MVISVEFAQIVSDSVSQTDSEAKERILVVMSCAFHWSSNHEWMGSI